MRVVPDEIDQRESLERSERRRRAILRLAALDKSDFPEVLRGILVTDADELGVERVNCWALDGESQTLRCICGVSRVRPEVESGTVISHGDIPIYFHALALDPIILADDARADPRTSELRDGYLVPKGITSLMDVPIWVHGGLWGVICHEHVGPPRHWTEEERDFAVSIGHIVSMAVEARDRARAERVARSSEFFVGILGHELRNPLNAARLLAEHIATLTSHDPYLQGVLEAAKRIVANVDRMARMVGQILDFTRIRLGEGLPVELEAMDLAEVTRRVVAEVRTAKPEPSVDVQVIGDVRGRWDPDRMWQLLTNLISNAIEHGTDPRVVLDGTEAAVVEARVCNRGTVSPPLASEIFEPFRRREGARGSGLGLGLFIARPIATAHGGSIELESGGDQTVFTVRLPRLGADPQVSSAHGEQPPAGTT
jgi:signal transduction histidine kinase